MVCLIDYSLDRLAWRLMETDDCLCILASDLK